MIKICITYSGRENPKYILLEMSGHANSAPKGEDLVCAAASAIMVGGMNALYNKKQFNLSLNEGYALIKRRDVNVFDERDDHVIETIVTQLKTLRESNPKFIKIEERNEQL